MANEQAGIMAGYLKLNHIGQGNAITSTELAEMFGYSRRHLINVIRMLRKKGFAICSCGYGYYYAKDKWDFKLCIDDLRVQQMKLEQSINLLYDEMEETI